METETQSKRKKQIFISIDEATHSRYKESGMKASKVFEFGISYPPIAHMLKIEQDKNRMLEERLIRLEKDNLRLASVLDYMKKNPGKYDAIQK